MRLLAVLLCLLAAGCTSAVAGEPRQTPNTEKKTDQVDHYGLDVDWRDDLILRLGKEIRALDPCRLLSDSDFPELGALVKFGRNGTVLSDVGQCEADYDGWTLQVELGYIDVKAQQVGQIDGVPKHAEGDPSDGQWCRFYLRLPITLPPVTSDNPDVEQVPPAAYARIGAYGPDGACAMADKLAKTVIARLKSGAARKEPRDHSVPLSAQDPCAVIRHLPKGFTPRTYGFGSPYSCAFYLRRPNSRDTNETVNVNFRLDLESMNHAMVNGRHLVTLGGHEFIVQQSGEYFCYVTYLTGPIIDVNRDPNAKPTNREWTLSRAQVVLQGGSCDYLQEIAAVLPELYGN